MRAILVVNSKCFNISCTFFREWFEDCVKGKLVSRSYIELTIALLRSMGVDIEVKEEPLSFKIHPLLSNKLKVLNQEGDWSAASYYYSIIALSPIGKLRLCLKGAKHSCQGDSNS